jgi:hypothetical protein
MYAFSRAANARRAVRAATGDGSGPSPSSTAACAFDGLAITSTFSPSGPSRELSSAGGEP